MAFNLGSPSSLPALSQCRFCGFCLRSSRLSTGPGGSQFTASYGLAFSFVAERETFAFVAEADLVQFPPPEVEQPPVAAVENGHLRPLELNG